MKRLMRQRDGQQWVNDYLLKITGRPVHYELDSRLLPSQAKSMRMVSKYLIKEAEHAEHLAISAERCDDKINARALFRVASKNIVRHNILLFQQQVPKDGRFMPRHGPVHNKCSTY